MEETLTLEGWVTRLLDFRARISGAKVGPQQGGFHGSASRSLVDLLCHPVLISNKKLVAKSTMVMLPIMWQRQVAATVRAEAGRFAVGDLQKLVAALSECDDIWVRREVEEIVHHGGHGIPASWNAPNSEFPSFPIEIATVHGYGGICADLGGVVAESTVLCEDMAATPVKKRKMATELEEADNADGNDADIMEVDAVPFSTQPPIPMEAQPMEQEHALGTNKHDTTARPPAVDIAMCKSIRQALECYQPGDNQAASALRPLKEADNATLALMLKHICLYELSDEVIHLACRELADQDTSYTRCIGIVHEVLRPKVETLNQPASRVLFSTVNDFATSHPKPIVSKLLLPLMHQSAVGTAQGEVVNRILKDSSNEMALTFLSAFLEGRSSLEVQSGPPVLWTEVTMAAVNTVIGKKLTLDPTMLRKLVDCSIQSSQQLAQSQKFAGFLFRVVQKHGDQMLGFADQIRGALEHNDTFMKKNVLNTLAKLEAKGAK